MSLGKLRSILLSKEKVGFPINWSVSAKSHYGREPATKKHARLAVTASQGCKITSLINGNFDYCVFNV